MLMLHFSSLRLSVLTLFSSSLKLSMLTLHPSMPMFITSLSLLSVLLLDFFMSILLSFICYWLFNFLMLFSFSPQN